MQASGHAKAQGAPRLSAPEKSLQLGIMRTAAVDRGSCPAGGDKARTIIFDHKFHVLYYRPPRAPCGTPGGRCPAGSCPYFWPPILSKTWEDSLSSQPGVHADGGTCMSAERPTDGKNSSHWAQVAACRKNFLCAAAAGRDYAHSHSHRVAAGSSCPFLRCLQGGYQAGSSPGAAMLREGGVSL